MPHYDSTADVKKLLAYARGRVAFKSGGKVTKKTTMVEFSKGKRLRPGIRLKGGKSFIEEYRRRLNKKADGGIIDFKHCGSVDDVLRKLGKEIKANPLPLKTKSLLKQLKKSYARRKYKKGGKAKDSVHQPTTHSWWLLNRNKRDKKAKGGKADKNWIQGVNKSIKKRGTKGVCTGKKFGSASCKPGSRRYNLAKTFKKMARAKHASGGLVRYI